MQISSTLFLTTVSALGVFLVIVGAPGFLCWLVIFPSARPLLSGMSWGDKGSAQQFEDGSGSPSLGGSPTC